MKKASAGLMVANEVAKTKGGQEAISGTMQTANRVQSVIGWTITALVLAGGGYLIWRFLVKPTLDKAENAQEDRASIKEAELVLKEYEKLGLNVDQLKDYKRMADAIQEALNGFTEDDDAVANQLMLVSNDAEYEALRIAWGGVDGSRPISGGFLGGGSFTLTSAIQKYLDDSNKRQVNMNYASKNMKTRI